MKYFRRFATREEYLSYMNGEGEGNKVWLPNISFISEESGIVISQLVVLADDVVRLGDTVPVQVITIAAFEEAIVTVVCEGTSYSGQVINGVANFEIPDLTLGEKIITASISVSGMRAEGSKTIVVKKECTLQVSPKDISVGQSESLTVFTPSDATGIVYALLNGVRYEGGIIGGKGKARITIPNLPVGNYIVTVIYDGDDTYLPSSKEARFRVYKK